MLGPWMKASVQIANVKIMALIELAAADICQQSARSILNPAMVLPYKGLGAAAWMLTIIIPNGRNAHSANAIVCVLDGTIADTKRARNVCHACMLRKKACDKALPACGFCTSRQLLCRYDILAPETKDWRTYHPGRHFVPLQSQSPPSVSPQAKVMAQQLPSPEKQHLPTPIHYSSLRVLPQSVEESLHQLTQHFTELTKLTYDDIVDRFFQVFHTWLPIVSPDSFRQEASRYREEGCLPPAGFTVVLLAMLLIVLPTLDPPLRLPRARQEFLYTTTKSAISQAQASICTSLRLVQAALLMAVREYTCVRPEAAYISMMTCAGLARVLGIEITSVRTTRDAQYTRDSRLERMERDNVAWAIAMLERYE